MVEQAGMGAPGADLAQGVVERLDGLVHALRRILLYVVNHSLSPLVTSVPISSPASSRSSAPGR